MSDAAGQDASEQTADAPGAIAGVVVDAQQGEPLPGANVSIKGTTTGTSTDLNGRYRLGGLEPGTYDVLYSFVGFQKKTITDVEVSAGETTQIEVTLGEQTAQMDEVVVKAQAARDTEAGLLKDRAKAAAISNAIGAETMSAAGAGTAAAAMKKITGASVVEGKYVVVRGLGGRYSKTMLNGVDIPSADPEEKSVQLDLFPTSLLSNIKTTKTFTPDQPGNFSGGLVNISTKSFPKELNFTLSTSTTINPQVQFANGFITHDRDRVSWLGFAKNGLSVPPILERTPTEQIPNQPILAENPQRYSRLSKSFSGSMAPQSTSPPVNQSYSLSLGNQNDLFGRPLGYVVGVTLDRSASFYSDGTTGRYELAGTSSLTPIIRLEDRKSTITSTIGGIANVTYKLAPNHELGLNSLYTHTGETLTRLQKGEWTEAGSNDVLTNRALLFQERDVLSLDLNGESYFEGLGGTRLQWKGAYSTTSQEEPNRRFFASLASVSASGDTTHSASLVNLRNPARIFRSLSENQYSGQVDVTVPFRLGGREGEVKLGGSYNHATRDFSERFFSYNPPQVRIPFSGDATSYFVDENMGIVDSTGGRPQFGITVDDQTSPLNSYTGERTIGAGYLMAEIPIARRIRIIGGARLESTDLSVEATPEMAGRINTTDVLPSLNVVYEVTSEMNLRAAATRTLARPTFREIAPYPGFDFIQGEVIVGNPELNRTLISNLDLRWEWFPRPGEVLAASAYYKQMQDPIERAFISTSSNTGRQLTWKNVDEAKIFGAEFEARVRLDRFADALRNLTVGGNLSLTRSRIDVPCLQYASDDKERCVRGELYFRQVNNAPSTRELQGQSPYLLNLNLEYDNPETGTSGGLFYSVFGERLSVVSSGSIPDVYTQPRPELNASLSQSLLGRWEVELSVENILNSQHAESYVFKGETYPYQRHTNGRSFSFGITYSIH
ncbi:MAG: TonB-dependent receptor domain-containing protein [Salinibacter sp.]